MNKMIVKAILLATTTMSTAAFAGGIERGIYSEPVVSVPVAPIERCTEEKRVAVMSEDGKRVLFYNRDLRGVCNVEVERDGGKGISVPSAPVKDPGNGGGTEGENTDDGGIKENYNPKDTTPDTKTPDEKGEGKDRDGKDRDGKGRDKDRDGKGKGKKG